MLARPETTVPAPGRCLARLGPLGKACALVECAATARLPLARDLPVNPRRLLPVLYDATEAVAIAVDYLRVGNGSARQADQQSAQRRSRE